MERSQAPLLVIDLQARRLPAIFELTGRAGAETFNRTLERVR